MTVKIVADSVVDFPQQKNDGSISIYHQGKLEWVTQDTEEPTTLKNPFDLFTSQYER